MKKYLSFVVLASFVLSIVLSPVARAEDEDTTDSRKPPFGIMFKENREEKRGEREVFKETMLSERKAFRETMLAERKAFRETLETEREAFKKEVEAKKEEWKLANTEKKKEFWGRAKVMLGEGFDVVISKVEMMQERVANLIEEMEGEDTSLATEALESSVDKLNEAKGKVAEIKDLLPEDGEKITPEIFEQIKLLAREAKDLLKESREYLREAIKEIKALNVAEDEEEDEDEDDENEEESEDDEEDEEEEEIN